MELQPDITLGNFFNRQHRTTSSYQVVHVVTGHRDGFGGSHLFKAGVDLLHTRYDGTSQSQTVLIERADGTVARRLDFSGASVANDRRHRGGGICAGPSSAAPALVRRDGPPARSRRGARTREPLAADRHRGAAHRVRQRRDARRVGTVRRADAVDGGCVHQLRERGRHAVPHRRRVGRLARCAASRTRWRRSSRRRSSRTWDAAFDYRWNTRWAFHVGVLHREGRHESIVTPLVSRHTVSSGSCRATGIPAIATSNSARTTHAARRRTST